MNDEIVIEVKNFTKIYSNRKVLDNISFSVKRGIIIGIVGSNGSGKTTLLESIEGLRQIQDGNITVLGKDVRKDYKSVQKDIGIQLQDTSLFGNLTVKETFEMFSALYNQKPDINEMLGTVDLADQKNKKVIHLSGGQYQRFNLCLAILNNPKILFLDEPTTGLDPHARRNLWKIIEDLLKKNVTIILTTHYMDEAQAICDKILILHDGHIVANDTPVNLINQLDAINVIITDFSILLNDIMMEELKEKYEIKYLEKQLFIYTTDIGNALNVLFEWSKRQNLYIENINIRTPNLDDVFIHFTSSMIN